MKGFEGKYSYRRADCTVYFHLIIFKLIIDRTEEMHYVVASLFKQIDD